MDIPSRWADLPDPRGHFLDDMTRFLLRSISDDDAAAMAAFIRASGSNEAVADDVARLKSVVQFRALVLADDQVWSALTGDEQAAVMRSLPKRGLPSTLAHARGLIDIYLTLRAGELIETGAATGEPTYCPAAIAQAGKELAVPGAFADRFAHRTRILDPDALEANRSGRLTDSQVITVGSDNRTRTRVLLTAGAVLSVVVVLAFGHVALLGGGRDSFVIGFVAVVVLLAIAPFLYRVARTTQDLRSREVRSVEGDARRKAAVAGDATAYYIYVGRKAFRATKTQFDQAPEKGRIRLFVLPRSKTVVNFESLDDPVGES